MSPIRLVASTVVDRQTPFFAKNTMFATDAGLPEARFLQCSIAVFAHLRWTLTHKAHRRALRRGEGRPRPADKNNTASNVWADTAYRSKKNETHMAKNGFVSQVHRKKPKGKPMPERTSKANGRKSKVRALVEHVFAAQKGPMVLFIRTVGIARARTKIGMANLVYNMKRLVWLEARSATG